MSRYRKVITGETELPEMNGTKFLIYPTLEHRMKLLEIIKKAQIVEEIDEKNEHGKVVSTKRVRGGSLDLGEVANICASIVYEGCFEHDENGKRVKKKDEELETTEQQLLALVMESDVMSMYLEILKQLDIISKEKAEELKSGQNDAEKKQ